MVVRGNILSDHHFFCFHKYIYKIRDFHKYINKIRDFHKYIRKQNFLLYFL